MDKTALLWADLHSLRKGMCVYLYIYFCEEAFELCILGVTTFVENQDILSGPHFVTCLQKDGLKVLQFWLEFGLGYAFRCDGQQQCKDLGNALCQ